MIKIIFGKVMWAGRATVFAVGLAVILAVVLGVATATLAAVPGDPFRLGKGNTINDPWIGLFHWVVVAVWLTCMVVLALRLLRVAKEADAQRWSTTTMRRQP